MRQRPVERMWAISYGDWSIRLTPIAVFDRSGQGAVFRKLRTPKIRFAEESRPAMNDAEVLLASHRLAAFAMPQRAWLPSRSPTAAVKCQHIRCAAPRPAPVPSTARYAQPAQPAHPAHPARNDPCQNQLLAALHTLPLHPGLAHLESVDLPPGKLLHEPGDCLTHLYFPTTAVVSLQHLLEDGACDEVAVVGRDGMVGTALLLGGETTTNRAVVQTAGRGYRLHAKWLTPGCPGFGPMLQLLLRYTQALMSQIAQTASCNRHHSVDQQLCRWLLRHLDLLSSNELAMTHEQIANALGVRREGVTEVVGRLQRAGLVSGRRGHITVLDRHGLARRSCECYAAARAECERLLPADMGEHQLAA